LLIRHSGVAAGSLGAVEKAAGVGRSQLYHYFSDREDLLPAVVTRNGHGLADRATTALGRRRGAAALNEWFDAAIAAIVAGGGVGGELRPDVRRLADQIMAAMQGGLLMAQVRRDPAQLAAALDGARQLVAAGTVSR
jgi:AcrR family transcriptional regulator